MTSRQESISSGYLPESIAEPSFATAKRSVRSWLLTTDHKRIAILYFFGIMFSLGLGGVLALMIRTEHLTGDPTIMSAGAYNRTFTMHGVVMVFMFMIPSIPTVFGNFLIPIMIGARDLAFPKINLASFYVYLVGSLVVLLGMIVGGTDTGWTFYTPYSTRASMSVVPVVIGVFIIGVSSIMTGLNFIVTVHSMRAEGVTWSRMPLFVWSIYATSIIQVLATPVLGIALALVGVDRLLHWGIFDPARGGDPVLFQHLFWFYSHPAVYIMILPAMGVVSECVCTFARNRPLSYTAIAASSLGIAFVGFLTWGHHMFVAGMSSFDAGAFGVLSMLVGIFSAIKVYAWVGTLYRGSIVFNTPFLYVFVFLFLFIFGGMTGVAFATMSLDVQWHDTYFVVAHFHFIMVGGTISAFLAALHYWFPKMTGRMYSERWGLVSATLVFAGFFLTFFPQFLLGNAGMPRRYYSYPPQYQALHVTSTLGSYALSAAMMITFGYLLAAMRSGRRAGDNPWGSASFEWRTASPPPEHNFHGRPPFEKGPYDYPVEGSVTPHE